ncbi:hypothetical protein BPNPMPFG_005669 [Mesorhizobium sp. AR07]|uniref:hypothetical protein n=1 Tax=Mesorhizobium sp. AR07 TaxID=2865838 RepID=UPI00215F1D59|nr:hypothetical protein [Mesorhizobium sp. AR07]UVK43827.1 hypothetical protein BPNPMPFG_005669 [Mesorhizobium sp. AR07]
MSAQNRGQFSGTDYYWEEFCPFLQMLSRGRGQGRRRTRLDGAGRIAFVDVENLPFTGTGRKRVSISGHQWLLMSGAWAAGEVLAVICNDSEIPYLERRLRSSMKWCGNRVVS